MKLAITKTDRNEDFQILENSPWVSFVKKLHEYGFSLVSLKDKPDSIVFMNFHFISFIKHGLLIPRHRRIIVLWEPSINNPIQHTPVIKTLFGRIFVPSKLWKTRNKEIDFLWPQTSEIPNRLAKWNQRTPKIILVNSNQVSFSSTENYSLRRFFAKELSTEVVLVGRGWNSKVSSLKALLRAIRRVPILIIRRDFKIAGGKDAFHVFSNYSGSVQNKIEEMEKYKFALVIENCSNYVSEKLIDALIAGCIPLYIGPDLEDFEIPEEVVVRIEAEPGKLERELNLLLANEELCLKKLELAEKFLKSEQFARHLNNNVLSKLGEDISDYLIGRH